eukprot:gene16279-22561_t
MLLQAGADIQARKKYRRVDKLTALLIACQSGHSNVVKVLLQAGADIQAKNQDGVTALMLACDNGHSNVVEMLLQ